MMIDAVKLRDKSEVKKIENKPGYYKWWAEREDFDLILDKLNVNFDTIKDSVEIKDDLYCIYVGIAVKESVGDRLKWHVNDKHTISNVKHGFLSTFRNSISPIISDDLLNKEETDEFIDKLKVEYFLSSYDIKSEDAKNEIETIEKDLLVRNLYVLNLKDNKHPLSKPIKKELRALRKEAKTRFLESIEN